MPKIDKWAEVRERERAEALAAMPLRGRLAHRLWSALSLTMLVVFVLALSGNAELLRSLWRLVGG